MKIAHIVGARPQFIKYFPVHRAFDEFSKNSDIKVKEILIHTGQHYDYAMSEVFFKEFGIKSPDYHLGVGSGYHGQQTGQIIAKTEEVLLKERPDVVVVYGDTNSTLGGALTAIKLHIPVVHVEAGLRSFNKRMPEEINRVLTDHVSTVLLCPSEIAVKNLRKEGFTEIACEGKLIPPDIQLSTYRVDLSSPLVFNVGDVMYDVLLHALSVAESKSRILETLQLTPKSYALMTIHRAENTDNPVKLDELFKYVNNVASLSEIIFPVHPRTKKTLDELKVASYGKIRMIEPVGYFDMIWLLKNSAIVFTDSGGLQKEAYWLEIPCVTLREETEWVETVESGCNVLYKEYDATFHKLLFRRNFYGDGKAAQRIVNVITQLFRRIDEV